MNTKESVREIALCNFGLTGLDPTYTILSSCYDHHHMEFKSNFSLSTLKSMVCSHDPRSVSYPGANVTFRSQDNLLSRGQSCRGASSSSSDHYEFILNTFCFEINCYRE